MLEYKFRINIIAWIKNAANESLRGCVNKKTQSLRDGVVAWIQNAVIASLLAKQTRVERSVTRRTDHLQINLNKNIFYGKYLTIIIDIAYLYKNIFILNLMKGG